MSLDTFKTRKSFTVGTDTLEYFSLTALEQAGFPAVGRLPFSLKILLENLLRREDNAFVRADDIRALAGGHHTDKEISFMPARVLLQDFTGVPCVVDLAAMRDGIAQLGGDPETRESAAAGRARHRSLGAGRSLRPADSLALNAELEYQRNRERYVFLRWGQTAFRNFRVVPPETGIVHQVNIEYLARVVCRETSGGRTLAYPDTVFGTDSHTTMVNGLGVVGWGVGGIEAEAAMLGQPSSMLIPQVVGYSLAGQLPEGIDGDRPRADDHRSAAQARRRRQVRRVLRTRPEAPDDCGSRDARQHVSGVRRHGRDLSDRRHDARLPALHRPRRGAGRARRGLREGAGLVPDRRHTGRGLLGNARAGSATVEPSLAGPRRPQDRVPLGDVEDLLRHGAA